MARQAVPGRGREGQCIRPGCRAGPGIEGAGKGRTLHPGAWSDGGAGRTPQSREERDKAQGTLWGDPQMCCGAWEIPPRGMGVIKAWAVPLEKGGERGSPGST